MPAEPIPTLLSKVLADLTHDLEQAGTGTLPAPSSTMWANLLQHVDSSGVALRDIASKARISKRAARSAINGLTRLGYVETVGSPKTVTLTPAGARAQETWLALLNNVERRWQDRIGADAVRALRVALEAIVQQLELEFPLHPIGYGAADPSVGAGGQDWKPVYREPDGDVTSLALSALLSQTLMAYSLDYERESGAALALAANVFRLVSDAGTSIEQLPHATHLSGLQRHGYRELHPHEVVQLTPQGKRVRDEYHQRLDAIERSWESQYGAHQMRRLRRSLHTIADRLNDGLPHHPPM